MSIAILGPLMFVTACEKEDAATQAMRLGDSYYFAHDMDKAIAKYNEAIRLAPEKPTPRAMRGKLYAETGDVDKAIADFTEAIRLAPEWETPRCARGKLYSEIGDVDKAITDFTEAIRLAPWCAEPHYHLGLILHARGDMDEAIAEYDESIRLGLENIRNRIAGYWEDDRLGNAYYHRGLAYEDEGDTGRAEEDFAKAIAEFRGSHTNVPSDYVHLGEARKKLGDLRNAIHAYTSAIRLNPDYAEAYTLRGRAYADQGDADRAIADYTEAIRLKPDDAEAYYHRGFAYNRKGEESKAETDFAKAKDFGYIPDQTL